MSSSNKRAKQKLIELYGEECFIDKLHLRKGNKEKYTSKGQYKKMKQLTYHHITKKEDGGKATLENGALLSLENHIWFNKQSPIEQARLNDIFQQYKMGILEINNGKIINSEINAEAPAAINIKAKKLRIKNSKLQSPEIYIDSQSIEFDGTMQASDGVMIENANYDFSGSVMAPIILYNGIDLANKINSTCNITADVVALAEARKEFGEKLKIVSDYCQQINARKMQVVQNNLNNRSVLRTLKKK